jgi:hypothetical protein
MTDTALLGACRTMSSNVLLLVLCPRGLICYSVDRTNVLEREMIRHDRDRAHFTGSPDRTG